MKLDEQEQDRMIGRGRAEKTSRLHDKVMVINVLRD
jgi:hypothetical protein